MNRKKINVSASVPVLVLMLALAVRAPLHAQLLQPNAEDCPLGWCWRMSPTSRLTRSSGWTRSMQS